MAIRPYILSEANWKIIKDTDYEVAILPWGATEAHNYHLPYSTDNIQNEHLAAEAARIAWEAGVKSMVLPSVPFGVNCAQLGVKFNINMNPSTQFLVLRDIVESLYVQKIPKLIIVNGHGGNHFSTMIRELYPKFPVFICVAEWYRVAHDQQIFEEAGDHAGEMETSLMMHLRPDIVLPLSEAGNGKEKKIDIPSLNQGWAWAQRGWLRKSTEDTGIGNPHSATLKKGEKLFEVVSKKISQLIIEVGKADLQNIYK